VPRSVFTGFIGGHESKIVTDVEKSCDEERYVEGERLYGSFERNKRSSPASPVEVHESKIVTDVEKSCDE
jgi:hypothetical protein